MFHFAIPVRYVQLGDGVLLCSQPRSRYGFGACCGGVYLRARSGKLLRSLLVVLMRKVFLLLCKFLRRWLVTMVFHFAIPVRYVQLGDGVL